jgi:hypothetical protein
MIAKIQSAIGLEEKPTVSKGQEEFFQRIRAKLHSRKIWQRVSSGPLQKGQTQAFTSSVITKRPILAREGKISQAIFQSA